MSDYQAFVQKTFGGQASEVLRLYPATTDTEVRTSSWRLLGEQVFYWPTWTSARLQARYMRSPVWYYEFMRAPPIPANSKIVETKFAGAFHLAGVLYAFGNLDVWQWDWSDADRMLSKKIMKTWVRFVRSGTLDSTQGGGNYWPALSSTHDVVRIWDGDGELRLKSLGTRAREVMAFWDRHYAVDL
ncbi:hypothetical protein NUW58_g4637 [Xylaria curta]|uniref:Uncharacterized protein n=1 Tax=Xylaria curta TaxID=42375 RepID=A0ACC1P6F1_9PEZI|nr:hypothetical protein NUW58_g4637 [Xylaria curta]